MAEEPKKEEAPAEAPKAGKGPLVIIMAVLAAVTVGAAGGIFFMLKKMPKAPPAVGAAATPAEAAPPPEEPPAEGGEGGEGGPAESVITMAPFIVNLEDEGSDAHFLKVTIAVELVSPKWAKKFDHDVPKVRNAVLLLLGNLKMSNTQGTQNKKKILEQLRSTITETVGKSTVRDIYLTEFVIQ